MKPDREATYVEPAGSRAGRYRRTNKRPRLRDERGQAVTEFAMVIPLFATLVFVCIILGKALYVYIQLTHTANEAARLAAVNYQPASGQSLCNYLATVANPHGVTLTISYPDPSLAFPADQGVGEPVKIQASGGTVSIPLIGRVLNLSASATMRIEDDTSSNTFLRTTAPASPCTT